MSLLVNLVANGMTVEEIMDEYPDLESEDIQLAGQLESGALVSVNERGIRARSVAIKGWEIDCG